VNTRTLHPFFFSSKRSIRFLLRNLRPFFFSFCFSSMQAYRRVFPGMLVAIARKQLEAQAAAAAAESERRAEEEAAAAWAAAVAAKKQEEVAAAEALALQQVACLFHVSFLIGLRTLCSEFTFI
jgi:hypothetical protein